MKTLLLLSLSLAACKWTEFDDLRDDAWVKAITKRDGSKASNWGVGLVRSGVGGNDGGSLMILGTLQARIDQANIAADGEAKFESADVDLGNIAAIDALAAEPIVIADPNSSDYSLVTVATTGQVVVAEGTGLNLQQNVIQKTAGLLSSAAYMVPPLSAVAVPTPGVETRDGRTAGASQVILASGTKLFGAQTDPRPSGAFNQQFCDIAGVVGSDTTTPIGGIRAVGAVRRDAADPTDDVAVWTDAGDIVLIDGQVWNGGDAAVICPPTNGVEGATSVALATAVPDAATPFVPGEGTLAQMLTFGGHFAVLQGHDGQNSFLQLWDFGTDDLAATAGVPIGDPITEAGLTNAALIEVGGKTFVAAGYPGAVIDGVPTGKVEIYEVDTTMGILQSSAQHDTLSDAQPEDNQSFGRAITAMQYNGQQVLAIAANNEVFVYFRTPHLYNVDARR